MIVLIGLVVIAILFARYDYEPADWREYTLNNLEWAILEEHLGGSKR